jgi:predicted DNA-binding protein (MmcQ/YjbR family)
MVTLLAFKQIALSFPDVTEQPHFEKTSFRTKKKIFATLSMERHRATVKLSEIDQSVFCAFDKTIIYPVDSKWAKQGWTHVDLRTVKKNMLKDLLKCAYAEVTRH